MSQQPPEDCPICFNRIQSPAVTDPCQHWFCLNCIVKWTVARHFNQCPVCRQNVQAVKHHISNDQSESMPVEGDEFADDDSFFDDFDADGEWPGGGSDEMDMEYEQEPNQNNVAFDVRMDRWFLTTMYECSADKFLELLLHFCTEKRQAGEHLDQLLSWRSEALRDGNDLRLRVIDEMLGECRATIDKCERRIKDINVWITKGQEIADEFRLNETGQQDTADD